MAFSHAALATTGLVTWAGYLITHWTALAWAALGLLLPVAGLGIATLIDALPDPGSDATGEPGPGSRRAARAPVVVIVAHGALATGTLLLVLLGAVSAQRGH